MPRVATCEPIIGPALTERLKTFHRPTPVAAPLIASDSLRCARRIGYRLFGTRPDIPFTSEEKARFEDGDFVDAVASECFAIEKGARTQIPFNWLPAHRLKGKADIGYRDGNKVVGEVKSASASIWSKALGLWRGQEKGPLEEWLIQVGLAALSPTVEAPLVHIVMVNNETFEVAEWLLDVDAPLTHLTAVGVNDDGEAVYPSIRHLVEAELARQDEILELVEKGTLPSRVLPGYGVVRLPPAREEIGQPWQCRFCPFQPSCSLADPGPVVDFGELAA